ncbi:MAG: methyl-accepting chemotaxis protein [Gammaproteobacteria bacterium (ex Lamellibrachia satsuma)]|nr:MAG: DUF4391 domain-containing protein [Gammaproteobacteria bacterium (ex Lamellibrachia satsuma)]RRS32373.1 MAG: methyl-accepting chemotaxis protein [Gammaproteobacteria bacterium (ex Lamellibrachia satsuma)]RRS35308.1 MAG: methyl-accepting chemotaxis protein [Gammaproteobacteria bacterium (ex Lamellibrachia satsuma)]
MTGLLLHYPKQAAFGRVVPKNKIYQHAKPSRALKQRFVEQIDKIIWRYKLAPETINLPRNRSVPEIEIFEIQLKTPELKEELLRAIDLAIPFPILFELRHQGQIRFTAAYKRPSEADGAKWVVDGYLSSPWIAADTERKPLPVALDLARLYEQLLRALLPLQERTGETLPDQLNRYAEIQRKERERDKLESRLHREKQFNRKVEINAELRAVQEALAALSA